MPIFKNRQEAGHTLAQKLISYRDQPVVVLGLPRGGVILAAEIASMLNAPLDLAFARKIGHPLQEEYAIAAISEKGNFIGNEGELKRVDQKWLKEKQEAALAEIKERRHTYLKERNRLPLKDKTVILADDGIATGLSIQAAIQEIKNEHPKKLIIAVPVLPEYVANILKKQIDELIAIRIDPDHLFLGSVGAYYEKFEQVTDQEIISIMNAF